MEFNETTSTSASDATSRSAESAASESKFGLPGVDVQAGAPTLPPMTTREIVQQIEKAAKAKRVDDVNVLVEQLLARESAEHNPLLLRELLDILVDSKSIYRMSVSRILIALQSARALGDVSLRQYVRIAWNCLPKSPYDAVDVPIFSTLMPIFTDYALRVKSNPQLAVDNFFYSRAVWMLFQIMLRLVQSRQYQVVLNTLRILVDNEVIPEAALEGMDVSDRAFSSIILVILVRASLHWRWRNKAAELLNSRVEWDENKH